MMRKLLVIGLLLAWAGFACAQLTCPDFVANDATGGVHLWDSAPGDRTFSFIQFEADGADAPLSFWWWDGDSLEKTKPKDGEAATDTTIIVKDGKTELFFFPFERPSLVYVGSDADHVLKAE